MLPLRSGSSHQRNLKVLRLCGYSYFYIMISWEKTRGKNFNGKHDAVLAVWILFEYFTILEGIFWTGVILVGLSWMGIFWEGIAWVGVIWCGNFPDGSYPLWEFSWWELSRWELPWVGILLGGNFPDGNYPVGIIRVVLLLSIQRLTPTSSSYVIKRHRSCDLARS